MEIRPARRVSHTAMQTLVAPPERVFSLYCPVREMEWVRGWDPPLVISESGVAECDCFFTTHQGGRESMWLVTEHDEDAGRVSMVKITPEVLACRIIIDLAPLDGGRSLAVIAYTYTSLGPDGDAMIESFTEEVYAAFMKEWSTEMNYFLKTGEKMCDED